MEYVLYYGLGINLFTYVLFGLDKVKARNKKWRIPENTLFFLSFIGGSIGALLAMKKFRHKTQKSEFKNVIYLILTIQLALLIFILWQLYIKT
ncbi:MAG TPA: DUF1294 domain-containing protein [Faecalibacter sp.]|uniref:DUF1294 domain-containing protein n=1 Tax=Faecalibacter sp. LW9 TaxID=3103144 RepID=UPI002AFE79CC|nr:DUF1294 domain-containing protein [Faecalibacter sp. LW9]